MPKTSRPATVFPISLRELQVGKILDVTSGMRRVTLVGDQLKPFTSANGFPQPAFESPAFDDSFRMYFTAPGDTEPVLPTQADGHLERAKDPASTSRVYTVRRWDAERGELDIDFVKHGTGVATTWAFRAQVGDKIHIGGPGSSLGLPEHADWLLVAGDDTALPAIGRLLEDLPEDARGIVFIEVAEDAHRQELRELPGMSVTWLSRNGVEAGATTLLLDAVKNATWLEGKPFAWVAGEQAAVRDIRRYLVEERQLPKPDVEFTGYWRHTEVVALEGDAAVPDPKRNTPAFEKFHDLVELVPPIAIRVAVQYRIGDLISRGVKTAPELAAKAGVNEYALVKLLRYLQALELLSQPAPGTYELTEVGEFMANEFWSEHLDPTGVDGRMSAGIFGLAESLRTGKPAYASVTGQEWDSVRADQAFEDAFLDRIAPFQSWFAVPAATSGMFDGVKQLVIHSAGAGGQAKDYVARLPELQVTICALPTQADWLRRDLPESIPNDAQRARVQVVEQSIFEPTPAADAVFVYRALSMLPDADATHALKRCAQNLSDGGRVLLVEDTYDLEELDDHDGEADLIGLTRTGAGLRTDDELAAVIAAAELELAQTRTVGWGTKVYELTRRQEK